MSIIGAIAVGVLVLFKLGKVHVFHRRVYVEMNKGN